jgi:hypothetical protein
MAAAMLTGIFMPTIEASILLGKQERTKVVVETTVAAHQRLAPF